jgi:PKD repeat protein
MVNEDYVFSITPSVATNVRISLSNTELVTQAPIAINATIGLFILNGCPDAPSTSCVASVDDEVANPEISLVSLTAGTTYYIVVSSSNDNLFVQEFATHVNFDITIDEVFNNDAGITAISPISSACGLTDEEISCTIRNFGVNSISSLNIGFTVDGSNEIIENFSGTILPNGTANYTFTATADISEAGFHTIEVYTMLEGDQNPTNDISETGVTNSAVVDVFPFQESFESDFGEFYAEGTNSSWEVGSPAPTDTAVINYAADGNRFAVTNLAGAANNGEDSYLYSPCFDLTNIIVPTLKFSIWTELGAIAGLGGTATIEASTNGGISYNTPLLTWDNTTGDWEQIELEIESLAGEPTVRFRIHYTAGFLASEGVAIDNFILKDENQFDASVGGLILPIGACGLSDSELVKLRIINYGAAPIENIPITYSLDSGLTWLPSPEMVAGPIAPGDSVGFTFNATADMSTPGSYQLSVKTMLATDEETDNDRRDFEIINTLSVDEIPYIEDFETANHGWVGSANSSWERGIPYDTLVINFAYSGDYVMATNPEGNTNFNENSQLISPCFDFSGLNGIQLSIAVWYETGFLPATISFEGSDDGGDTWFVIDNSWSGSSGSWIEYTYALEEFANIPNAKLRITYASQLLPAEGIAIDYIRINPLPANDIGVTQLIGPTSTCGLSSDENIQIEITNFGTATQTNFPLKFSINEGDTWITQNYLLQLASNQTAVFTFSSPVNFSTPGEYNVWVTTVLTGDENTSNDTLYTVIANTENVSEFPYQETFETVENGWFAYGSSSSLELGEPSATLINTAGEGDQSWVTNLTGNHNSGEISYLQGPCFDFSNMINPMIKAIVAYETSPLMSGFFAEYSTNGGVTWDTISNGGGGANWYGDALIPGFGSTWNGSSAGWIYVSTNLPELAGLNNVQLRFTFDSGTLPFGQSEGVGIDDINIYDCDNLPLADFEYSIDGTTVTFDNLSENGNSYVWNFGDNDIVPTTSEEESPVFEYTQPGQYTVTLTVTNECGSDELTLIIDVATSKTSFGTQHISLFPNPVSNELFINIGKNESSLIRIITIGGETIYETNSNTNICKISTENLPSGIYFAAIQTNSGLSYIRFIKQ